VSQPSAPFSVTVYAPPPAPLFTSVLSATVVAGSTFTLVGHAMPFDTVRVYDNGVLLSLPPIVANSLGFWTATVLPATSAGTHNVTTTDTDHFTGFVSTLLSATTVLTIAYPVVSVAATDAVGAEGGDPIVFTVTRTGSTSEAIVVNLAWSGTATFGAGGDYTVSGATLSADGLHLTLGPGVTSATVTVTPVDDTASEQTETVTLTLVADGNYALGSPVAATASILDNDADVVAVTVVSSAGAEQGTVPIVYSVSRTGALSGTINVTLAWSGTAKLGTDYFVTASGTGVSLSGNVLTLGPGAAGATVTATPIDDTTVESTETVVMTLSTGTGYSVGVPSSANGTIADNDAPSVVTVTATDASGAEDASDPITFTLTRTNTFKQIVVNLTWGGTATSADFNAALPLSVTFAAGQSTATVTVTPIDDAIAEATETVTLTIATGTGYTAGSPSSASGSILDNDASTVSLSSTDLNGSEQGPDPIVFTVSRSGVTTGSVTVGLAWSGTAKYGTDYMVTVSAGATLGGTAGTTLTFDPNITSATLTLTPLDDTTVESTETATLTLAAGTGYSVGSPASATGSILDNDATPVVTVTATDANGSENGQDPIVLTVTRTNSFKQIVVNLTWAGTATFGTDYTVTNVSAGTLTSNGLQLTLPAGVDTASITLTPAVDSTFESTETVILTASTGTGYSLGTPKSATGSIADNDTSLVTVTATDGAGAEAGPDPIVFSVARSGVISGTITVNLVWSGTATLGASGDYTVSATGTGVTLSADGLSLTFAPNATSATVTLTPVDDAVVESTETVTLTLGAGTGYNVGAPSSANGLITDNDSVPVVVTAGVTDASGAEQGSDPVTFTISRNSSLQSITVNLAWSGSATFGDDYTVSGSGLSADGLTLTLAAGVTSATITVTPKDDTLIEPTEGVTLTATTGSGYTVGSPASASGSILDNDSSIVSVTATDASGAEQGSDTLTFRITRGGALNGSITVALAWTGTATLGSDYTVAVNVAPGVTLSPDKLSLTLAAGVTGATLTLTPIDDSVAEGTESVFLTLTAPASGSGYTVGSPGSANASIVDNDALVAVTATDASGSETGPDPMVFTVSRTLSTAYQITVNLVWSGTAILGTDYNVTASGGTLSADKSQLTLAAGVASATLTVTPVNDVIYEGTETVIVTLATGSGYSAGSPSSATGSITDNDTAPKLSIAATQAVALESPSQAGVYTITRTLNLNGAITVNLSFGGTAAPGRYTLAVSGGTLNGTQLTMADGVTTATITLSPVADGTPEPSQTAVLTLGSGTGYALGTPTSATVTLYDTNAPTISIGPATVTIAGSTEIGRAHV